VNCAYSNNNEECTVLNCAQNNNTETFNNSSIKFEQQRSLKRYSKNVCCCNCTTCCQIFHFLLLVMTAK